MLETFWRSSIVSTFTWWEFHWIAILKAAECFTIGVVVNGLVNAKKVRCSTDPPLSQAHLKEICLISPAFSSVSEGYSNVVLWSFTVFWMDYEGFLIGFCWKQGDVIRVSPQVICCSMWFMGLFRRLRVVYGSISTDCVWSMGLFWPMACDLRVYLTDWLWVQADFGAIGTVELEFKEWNIDTGHVLHQCYQLAAFAW